MSLLRLKASNIRINQIYTLAKNDINEVLKLLDEKLEYPDSLYDHLFHGFMNQYDPQESPKLGVIAFIANHSEFIRNKLFDSRKWNSLFYYILLSSQNLSENQVKELFEDLCSSEFIKHILSKDKTNEKHIFELIEKYGISNFFENYMNEFFFNRYFSRLESMGNVIILNAIKNKAIEFLDLEALAEFIIRNKKYDLFDFWDLDSRKDIDENFLYKLKNNGINIVSLKLGTIIEKNKISKMTDSKELGWIGHNIIERTSSLSVWGANPHVSEEALLSVFNKIKEKYESPFNNYDPKEFFDHKEMFIVNLLKNPNCPEEIFHDVYQAMLSPGRKRNINESLREIAHTFVKYAPIDLAIGIGRKYYQKNKDSGMLYKLAERLEEETNLPEEKAEKAWAFIVKAQSNLKNDQKYYELREINFDIWAMVPNTILPKLMNGIKKMNDESLFGLYVKKDLSNEVREPLFNEIMLRLNDSSHSSFNPNLFVLVSLTLNSDIDIPKKHSDALKNYFIESFSCNEKNIEYGYENMVLPIMQNGLFKNNRFSLSELISLLSHMNSKRLKMNILELSPLPQNIRILFDESASWQSQWEHEVKSSYVHP